MGKLTIDECKRIISDGRRQLTEAQERIAELEAESRRQSADLYATTGANDKLEKLVIDLYDELWLRVPRCADTFVERMRELGIEVEP